MWLLLRRITFWRSEHCASSLLWVKPCSRCGGFLFFVSQPLQGFKGV